MVPRVAGGASTITEPEVPAGLVAGGDPRPATRTLRYSDGSIDRQSLKAYRALPNQSDAQILARVYPGVDPARIERSIVSQALASARAGTGFFPADPPLLPEAPRATSRAPTLAPGLAPPGTVTPNGASAESFILAAAAAGVPQHIIDAMREAKREMDQTLVNNLRPDPKLIAERKRAQEKYDALKAEARRLMQA